VDFATRGALALLGLRTDRELEARLPILLSDLRPQLERQTAATTTVATMSGAEGGPERDLLVHIHVAKGRGRSGRLLLIQPTHRGPVVEAVLRHAARDRALASLSRDAAHDLKGVLNLIVMNLQLLSRVAASGRLKPDEVKLAARASDLMRRELARLDRSIDLVLDRTSLPQDAPQCLDLRATCEHVAQVIAARAAHQGVRVLVDVGREPAEIHGFADRVYGVLLNLAVNALDAMPEGGRLSLRVRHDNETVHVDVFDSGPGIAADVAPHIWCRHFTTKRGGTGIGLYVARETIEAHGGHITHRPGDDGGTCFTLGLPRHR
jgi:signal transduction histidine kinase